MDFLSILVFGFLLGMKHATEADHLAAVATLATRESTLPHALRQGIAWGIGHTCTLLLVGGAVLAIGKALPPFLEPALESMVGLMLIALGADVLRRLAQNKSSFHRHVSDDARTQAQAHGLWVYEVRPEKTPIRFSTLTFVPETRTRTKEPMAVPLLPIRALAIGMMHGMAGSAALILLSLQSVTSITRGLIYIALFGMGSMAGMALLSVVIAIPLRLSAGSLGMLHKAMTAGVGLFSLGLGIWVIYRNNLS